MNRSMTHQVRRAHEGWTLIEVLIAVVILAVGILAVGTMQVSAIRGNFMSGNTSIGLTLAGEKMEDLLNRDYGDPALSAGAHEDFVSSRGTVSDSSGFYHRTWEITDTAGNMPEMKEMVVTVSWESDRHRVTLRSMRRE